MIARIGVLVVLGVAAAGCAASSAPPGLTADDVAAIRAAAAEFQQNVRDAAHEVWVTNSFTDDATLGPPNTPAQSGRDAILAWARTTPPSRDFTLRQVDVDGRGDLAYVYGKYSWVILVPGQPELPDSGKYIEVWKKQDDGSWKIIRDVFNSDVPLPAPAPPPVAK